MNESCFHIGLVKEDFCPYPNSGPAVKWPCTSRILESNKHPVHTIIDSRFKGHAGAILSGRLSWACLIFLVSLPRKGSPASYSMHILAHMYFLCNRGGGVCKTSVKEG